MLSFMLNLTIGLVLFVMYGALLVDDLVGFWRRLLVWLIAIGNIACAIVTAVDLWG